MTSLLSPRVARKGRKGQLPLLTKTSKAPKLKAGKCSGPVKANESLLLTVSQETS